MSQAPCSNDGYAYNRVVRLVRHVIRMRVCVCVCVVVSGWDCVHVRVCTYLAVRAKIEHAFVVDFNVTRPDQVLTFPFPATTPRPRVRVLLLRDGVKYVLAAPRHETRVSSCARQRVGLPRAGLAVAEDGRVVARGRDARTHARRGGSAGEWRKRGGMVGGRMVVV